MNESFEILPGISVGPFELGMPRAEVQSLFSCPITSFFKGPDSKRRSDDFTLAGIHVHYDSEDRASHIEAHMTVQYSQIEHYLGGNLVTGRDVGYLRDICVSLGHRLTDTDYGFEIPSAGLDIYSHDYESDTSAVDTISVTFKD